MLLPKTEFFFIHTPYQYRKVNDGKHPKLKIFILHKETHLSLVHHYIISFFTLVYSQLPDQLDSPA